MNNVLTEQLLLDVVKERELAGFGTEGRIPMKIKVGDWVKIACLDNTVAKVTQIDERGVHVYIGKLMQNLYTGDFIKCLTKLPIKFKGFEVKQVFYGSWGFADGVSEHRKIIQGNSHAKFFTEVVDETKKLFIGHVGKPYAIKSEPMTIIQARDWLELQYATLLAKARGLV